MARGARHLGQCLSAATYLDRGFGRHASTDAGNSIGDGIERPLDRDVQCNEVVIEGYWLIGRGQLNAIGIGERGRDAECQCSRSLESDAVVDHVSSVARQP